MPITKKLEVTRYEVTGTGDICVGFILTCCNEYTDVEGNTSCNKVQDYIDTVVVNQGSPELNVEEAKNQLQAALVARFQRLEANVNTILGETSLPDGV